MQWFFPTDQYFGNMSMLQYFLDIADKCLNIMKAEADHLRFKLILSSEYLLELNKISFYIEISFF